MSRSKRGSAADEIYDDFRGRQINNPQGNREAMIQRMYVRKLSSVAANRFKWTGLPKEIDIRFLEMTLLYFALSIFYYDNEYNKYFALRSGGYSYLNMLNNPTSFTVVGNGAFRGRTLSALRDTPTGKMAVPIWANYMRTPDLDVINIYATRLANLERTIEINSENARQSKFILSTQNQRLSFVNIDRQVQDGSNLIEVNNASVDDLQFYKVLDLEIDPTSIEKLDIVRDRQWNKCMTLLGIDSANQDKKERLVADEVSANDDQTSTFRFEALNARRIACEQINDHYPDLNISVEYNTEVERMAKEAKEDAATGETDTETSTEEVDN